jgi:Heterokaryon incompatibility protein (HET)
VATVRDHAGQPLPAEPLTYDRLDPSVDGIRLMTLLPCKSSDSAIACSLAPVPFSERPKYEALYNAWGSESKPYDILVNGKALEVGRNLYRALQNLRSTKEERTIWVDAICINQSDLAERNSQVAMMP